MAEMTARAPRARDVPVIPKKVLEHELVTLLHRDPDERVAARWERYRHLGLD